MYLLAHSKCANPHSGEVMNISYIFTLNDPRTHITSMNSTNFETNIHKEIMILKLVPPSLLVQFNSVLSDIFKKLKICEQADRNPLKNPFNGCCGNENFY